MDLERGKRLLLATRAGGVARAAFVLRVATGGIFAAFGVNKFTNHGSEVHSFGTYGLPSPDSFVYFIGVIETVGGVLLIIGLARKLAALVLSGDMVGAIASPASRKAASSTWVWPRRCWRRCCSCSGQGPGRLPSTGGCSATRDRERAAAPG